MRPRVLIADEFNLDRSYRHGFVIADHDNRYRLRLGGRFIGRTTIIESGVPFDDETDVKSARLYANLSFFDNVSFRIQGEFSGSAIFEETGIFEKTGKDSLDAELKDIYLEVRYVEWARLRAGQFKVPFTWESLQSSKHLDFGDRSIAVRNMRSPTRDIGGMLHGRLHDDRIQYQVAIVNGAGENTSDDNSAKDLVGRLFFRPSSSRQDSVLSDLHLGVSGTWGHEEEDYSNNKFKTVAGTSFVTFAEGVEQKGYRTRLGTELIWPIGPASLKAEWMGMWLENLHLESSEEDADFYGLYLSGTYLLTGEEKPLGKIVPDRPFSLPKRQWGAWEVAVRYSMFQADTDLFRLGIATGADRADAFTLGLNWYLNEFFRITLNYEHTEFDDDLLIDGESHDDEDAFLTQLQFEF